MLIYQDIFAYSKGHERKAITLWINIKNIIKRHQAIQWQIIDKETVDEFVGPG